MLARKEISLQSGTKLKKSLIIGWNIESVGLYDIILNTPALGYDVRGFVRPSGFQESKHYKNVPIVADLSNLSDALQDYEIEEVLVVLSPSEKDYLSQIISICRRVKVDYNIVSDAYEEDYSYVIRDVISKTLAIREYNLRRIFDIVGAAILLILLFPLFTIVSIAIKLDSQGPVFYSQQRYGKNGTIFAVYKFRSMVQDAEKSSGPTWAQKRDPRITRTGWIMRKTRIDELPQLMNILRGDMSFIGPRPERPFFADTFKRKIPFYMNRLKAKPGVTGLAQVTVGYDETIEDVREKVARDIEYIENSSSLRLNLRIMWRTFITVLMAEGQ